LSTDVSEVRTASIIIPDELPPSSSLIMDAVRTSETSVDNHFTRQYNPEDNSEQHTIRVFKKKRNPLGQCRVLHGQLILKGL
jgi:hypothetical protein